MSISIRYSLMRVVAALVLASTSGCANTLVQNGYSTEAAFNLTSAHVVWINSQHIPLKIMVVSRGAARITDSDKIEANRIAQIIFAEFVKDTTQEIKNNLAERHVVEGDQVVLEIKPIEIQVSFGGPDALVLSVAIKRKGSQTPSWLKEIRVVGASEGRRDLIKNATEMRQAWVLRVMDEMENAGWIKH